MSRADLVLITIKRRRSMRIKRRRATNSLRSREKLFKRAIPSPPAEAFILSWVCWIGGWRGSDVESECFWVG